jgi:hypothetical protein
MMSTSTSQQEQNSDSCLEVYTGVSLHEPLLSREYDIEASTTVVDDNATKESCASEACTNVWDQFWRFLKVTKQQTPNYTHKKKAMMLNSTSQQEQNSDSCLEVCSRVSLHEPLFPKEYDIEATTRVVDDNATKAALVKAVAMFGINFGFSSYYLA